MMLTPQAFVAASGVSAGTPTQPLLKGENMKFIIEDKVVLSRPLEGPLAAHIAAAKSDEMTQ
jgi:hypothetical protein